MSLKHVKLTVLELSMDILKEHPYWALFYHEGYEMDGDRLMGRQALLRALVQDNPDVSINTNKGIRKKLYLLSIN